MKYLKVFEEYKIKTNFGGCEIFPDFFKDSLLNEYYKLSYGSDYNYEDDKKFKKKAKKLKKEIIGYINDYAKLPEKRKIFGEFENNLEIIDFNLIFEFSDFTHKLKTMSWTNKLGTYKFNEDEFEDINIYLSDPELYMNIKKYNL